MLLALCCLLGCPLIMGGMMFMMRDREGSKLEREIGRLNAQADRRREAITTAVDAPATPALEQRLPAELTIPGSAG